MAHRADLEVRQGDHVVATLRPAKLGRLACRYSAETLDTHPGGTPLLSCSLPVQRAPADATAWCRGLLPEGQHLNALAANAGVLPTDTYGLLARYGRDIAGAYAIATAEPPPRQPSVEQYTADDLEREIAALDDNPLGVRDDSELSIAGLQDKLLVVRTPRGWARPRYGYPSTHIMKLDHRVYRGLIEAEGECLDIARSIGLTSIESHALALGAARVLVVSRFDRVPDGNGVPSRLHQEDLLQALGIAPDGRAKYQGDGPAPPSWWHLADLLDRYSADSERERTQLLRAAVFTTVIGNADGHGKNFALLHTSPGVVTLAPLYDTVPTALWPALRARAAMSVFDEFAIGSIDRHHIVGEARRWRLGARLAERTVTETCDALLAAVPMLTRDDLAALVRTNAERLLRG